ncbi:hypothetical protein OWI74_13710, partial [Mammaliicoccus sciuri]|nr:hypothetical protein [Mammaliicoccus sciuri]
ELELLNKFDDSRLDFKFLKANGLTCNLQGPMTLKEPLKSYIQKILKTNILNLDNELENIEYVEGKSYVQYGIKYERNQALRNEAIKIHGTTCKVCGFDFKDKYGDLGEGFIEIHHLKPKSTLSMTGYPNEEPFDGQYMYQSKGFYLKPTHEHIEYIGHMHRTIGFSGSPVFNHDNHVIGIHAHGIRPDMRLKNQDTRDIYTGGPLITGETRNFINKYRK